MHEREYKQIMLSGRTVIKVGDEVSVYFSDPRFPKLAGVCLRLFYSLVPHSYDNKVTKEQWISVRVTKDRVAPKAVPYDAEFPIYSWRVVGGRSFDEFVAGLK